MHNHKPVISIITVVLNASELLRMTIQSVTLQSYCCKEFVVINGGSDHATVAVLDHFGSNIHVCISEPDHGIYDAMNKGIHVARGEWIIFMNAGDVFFDDNILEKIIEHLDGDVVYGDHAIYKHNPDNYELVSVKKRSGRRNIPYCHQSVFIKRTLLKQNLFDLRYKISADYDQFLKLKFSGAVIKHIPLTVSKVLDGGVSSRSRPTVIDEYFDITKKYWPIYSSFVYMVRRLKFFLFAK